MEPPLTNPIRDLRSWDQPFKNKAMIATFLLSGFIIFSPSVETVLKIEREVLPGSTLVELVYIWFLGFSALLGTVIGHKTMVLVAFGAAFIRLFLLLVYMKNRSASVLNLAIVLGKFRFMAPFSLLVLFFYHFNGVEPKQRKRFGWAVLAILVSFSMVFFVLVPPNSALFVYGTYSLGMVLLVYFTIPDTPLIRLYDENHIGVWGVHVLGFVAGAVVHFVWLQMDGVFGGTKQAVFRCFCLLAEAFCCVVTVLGHPGRWKETNELCKEKKRSWRAFWAASRVLEGLEGPKGVERRDLEALRGLEGLERLGLEELDKLESLERPGRP